MREVVEGNAVVQEGAEQLNRLPGDDPAARRRRAQGKVTEVGADVEHQAAGIPRLQTLSPANDLVHGLREWACVGGCGRAGCTDCPPTLILYMVWEDEKERGRSGRWERCVRVWEV